MDNLRKDIIEIMWAGIHAVQPSKLMPEYLQLLGNRLFIAGKDVYLGDVNQLMLLAVGKAAAAMAVEAENILGDLIAAGSICITKYGHGLSLKKFYLLEAAHPAPDENSVKAAARVESMLESLSKDDILIMLVSGGASSLMVDLPGDCSLKNLQDCFELLVKSGADIHEINVVRKHLSKLKGGQLVAQTAAAKIYTLIISDVTGDDISSIASGPTARDKTSFADARLILEKYRCWNKMNESIRNYLEQGISGSIPETIKPGNPVLKKVYNNIIANNDKAINAVQLLASGMGYHPTIIAKDISKETAAAAADFVKRILHYDGPYPACIIMGGETSLQVSGEGKGGRNQHFILCALQYLLDQSVSDKNYIILSAGTDGTDEPTDANGAFIDSEMVENDLIGKKQLEAAMATFDSYTFFEKMGTLIKTGPTQTNVMDIMIALIDKKT